MARQGGGQGGGRNYSKIGGLRGALKVRPNYPRAWLESLNKSKVSTTSNALQKCFNERVRKQFASGRMNEGLKILSQCDPAKLQDIPKQRVHVLHPPDSLTKSVVIASTDKSVAVE